jgi:hypothetical protein
MTDTQKIQNLKDLFRDKYDLSQESLLVVVEAIVNYRQPNHLCNSEPPELQDFTTNLA